MTPIPRGTTTRTRRRSDRTHLLHHVRGYVTLGAAAPSVSHQCDVGRALPVGSQCPRSVTAGGPGLPGDECLVSGLAVNGASRPADSLRSPLTSEPETRKIGGSSGRPRCPARRAGRVRAFRWRPSVHHCRAHTRQRRPEPTEGPPRGIRTASPSAGPVSPVCPRTEKMIMTKIGGSGASALVRMLFKSVAPTGFEPALPP